MTRTETIAALASEILDGAPRHSRINLGYVLDKVLDESLFDRRDEERLITGDTDIRTDIITRAQNAARHIVTNWLTSEREGMALVDERIAREREDTEDYEEHRRMA